VSGPVGTHWPPFVVRTASIPESAGGYPPPFDAVPLSHGRDLGRAAGSRTLGTWVDRIPPGGRSSFCHAHLREEEVAYVLSGTPTLRWLPNGSATPQEVELQPGDLATFPAGTGIAHCFLNRSTADTVLLVVGERRTGERLNYPEDPAFESWRSEVRPHRTWPDTDRPLGMAVWPAWRLETERLVLRPWTVEDTPELLALQTANQHHLAPWMPWARALPNLDELLQTVSGFLARFASGEDWIYGIFLPDGTPIGGTGLHPRFVHGLEIGYWVAREHQGKGYVTEAAAALTRVALETRRVQAVEIHCDPRNTRSAAVPARLGFRNVAVLPGRQVDVHGQPRDSMVWTMLGRELPSSPAAAIQVVARDGLGRRLL
jgi:uncharacterized cupin superfamily protein